MLLLYHYFNFRIYLRRGVFVQKAKFIGLLPIIVFLVLFIGVGAFTGDIYAMPAVVGFIIALVVAFIQNPKMKFMEKMKLVAKGIGDDNIITMLFVFILSGAFSGIVKASGGVESTVNFGLSIIPANLMVVGIFVVGCFISVSMGTSVGTITALAPIAVGIANATGLSLPMCTGAVVCGAMFGDNLSMISDTTIAAVKTQGCNMNDKFKTNFKIVLPAAIITAIIFFALTFNSTFELKDDLSYNIFQVIPYLIVLVGALLGFNVFLVLITGTVTSLAAGIATGSLAVGDMFTAIGDGVTKMYDITVISIIVACISALIKEYGGIQAILYIVRSRIKTKKGAQFGIAALASCVDIATANNTIAIVLSGEIAKDISDEYGIEPKQSASLLDIFTSIFQGIIPYGAQLLTAAGLVGITSVEVIPYLYYPILMGISALLFIAFSKNSPKPKKG